MYVGNLYGTGTSSVQQYDSTCRIRCSPATCTVPVQVRYSSTSTTLGSGNLYGTGTSSVQQYDSRIRCGPATCTVPYRYKFGTAVHVRQYDLIDPVHPARGMTILICKNE